MLGFSAVGRGEPHSNSRRQMSGRSDLNQMTRMKGEEEQLSVELGRGDCHCVLLWFRVVASAEALKSNWKYGAKWRKIDLGAVARYKDPRLVGPD